MDKTYSYIAIMALTTFATRAIPVFLVKGQIKNKFIRSFLYYVPYVTLAVMTFPAIVEATSQPLAGLAAFIIGLVAAWFSKNLFITSLACCLTVLIFSHLF